uniref:Uncharacterized protein n=1 Tax=Tetranychus urticae TaxID=32264 RepID=T1JTH3_TETUR
MIIFITTIIIMMKLTKANQNKPSSTIDSNKMRKQKVNSNQMQLPDEDQSKIFN